MKERTKDVVISGVVLLLGIGIGSLAVALFGCTSGLQHLLAGLAIEDVLDPDEGAGGPGEDGQDGLNCWDLDGDGELSEDEDMDGDGLATAYDCRGPQGRDGVDGSDGEDGQDAVGLPGPIGATGPQGQPGATTVIVTPPPVDDGPPFGQANGHRP